MPWTSDHTKWLVDTGERLKTADDKEIGIWEFRHEEDQVVLSAWAKHFRNHYCLDTDIDCLRGNRTRQEFLIDLKFPCRTSNLGPGIRAGDFGEILVADYLEWLLGFWVPRVRWSSKVIRDESPKGSDVIGFHFQTIDGEDSANDVLIVFESKTKFSASGRNRLQEAINDSAKDQIRIDESLNFMKQRLFERGKNEDVLRIERFQNPVDFPYIETYGAAAIISEEHFNADELASANCSKISGPAREEEDFPHPNRDRLVLLVIKGENMMDLVHKLYKRAASEA